MKRLAKKTPYTLLLSLNPSLADKLFPELYNIEFDETILKNTRKKPKVEKAESSTIDLEYSTKKVENSEVLDGRGDTNKIYVSICMFQTVPTF